MIQKGANINLPTRYNDTALHLAAKLLNDEKGELMKILIDSNNADYNAINRDNWTPLHVCCSVGHEAIFHLLLRNNLPDYIQKRSKDGSSMLHIAAASVRNEKFINLVYTKRNVDINAIVPMKQLNYCTVSSTHYLRIVEMNSLVLGYFNKYRTQSVSQLVSSLESWLSK